MALRKTTASADLTSLDSHSALPWTNSANLEEIAVRTLASAEGDGSTPPHVIGVDPSPSPLAKARRGDGSTPITCGGGSWLLTRSRISAVTAPGPQPRSTITCRPGQMTRSRIQRLTYVKNGCRVNGVNEKRSSSAVGFRAVTACESRAAPSGRRDCG